MSLKTPTRRELLLTAAAAAAVFGARSSLAIYPAEAKAADGFFRFPLGDFEVITLYDGLWEKPHDPSFIANATVEETQAALVVGGLDATFVPIPFTLTLVKTPDKLVLFDAGTGGQLAPTAGQLFDSMGAANIRPEEITTVIVTHFHPDHIFGLMAKDTNEQVYPNAEIIVPEAEYAWWTDASVFTKLPEAFHGLAHRIQATFPTWKNIRRVTDGTEVLPGFVAKSAHGHTPGHTIYQVTSGKDVLLNLADTSNIPALFARNPGWHAFFDGDPAAAEANRRRLFDEAVATQAVVTGYHYGLPGAGRFLKDGQGYAFVPLA